MHSLPILRAAKVRKPRARDQTASRFFGMINRRQQLPLGFSAANWVVVQDFIRQVFPEKFVKSYARADRRLSQRINRREFTQQPDVKFFHNCNSPNRAALELDQSAHDDLPSLVNWLLVNTKMSLSGSSASV